MDQYGEKEVRDAETKKMLTSRINRITGQLNGVKGMIEEDRSCTEILIQLSAVEKAAKGLSCVVLEEHLRNGLVGDIQKGNLGSIDEVIDLFRKFQ